MEIREIFAKILGKNPQNIEKENQETPEDIKARIAAIDVKIKGVEGFQFTADSTGPSRSEDARRIEGLKRLRAQLEAKVPPQPEAVGVSKPILVVPSESRQPEVVGTTKTSQESKGTA